MTLDTTLVFVVKLLYNSQEKKKDAEMNHLEDPGKSSMGQNETYVRLLLTKSFNVWAKRLLKTKLAAFPL